MTFPLFRARDNERSKLKNLIMNYLGKRRTVDEKQLAELAKSLGISFKEAMEILEEFIKKGKVEELT